MRRHLLHILAPAVMAGAVAGEEAAPRLALPSGLEARFHERLRDVAAAGEVVRFRFVASAFSDSMPFETVMADLEYLCTEFVVPRVRSGGAVPDRVIISLADKPAEFGVFDPETDQVFEAYRIEDGACIWEMF
jgi:hypothetical protein